MTTTTAAKAPTTLGSILKHLGYTPSFIDGLGTEICDLDVESHCGKRCMDIAVRGIALAKAIDGEDENDKPYFDGESAEDAKIFQIVARAMHVILFG